MQANELWKISEHIFTRADLHASRFTAANLAPNLVALFLIKALQMFIERADALKINVWRRLFNRICCRARCNRSSALDSGDYPDVRGISGANAHHVDWQVERKECRCKCVCNRIGLLTLRARVWREEHGGVINVQRCAGVDHAVRSAHQREIAEQFAA
jgi:hypothetical protein